MDSKGQIIEIVISELDLYLIDRVRELRALHRPYMSQVKLSQKIELSEGYISKVENLKERAKYNIRALNKIAHAFELHSYSQLFPPTLLPDDMLRIRLQLPANEKKGKLKPDMSGNIPKGYRLISKRRLSEEEMALWNNNEIEYLTIIPH